MTNISLLISLTLYAIFSTGAYYFLITFIRKETGFVVRKDVILSVIFAIMPYVNVAVCLIGLASPIIAWIANFWRRMIQKFNLDPWLNTWLNTEVLKKK